MKYRQSMTLWSVIESMQNRLEKQGVDAERADAAILQRVRRLALGKPGPLQRRLAAGT